jgi:hypothetical protein
MYKEIVLLASETTKGVKQDLYINKDILKWMWIICCNIVLIAK